MVDQLKAGYRYKFCLTNFLKIWSDCAYMISDVQRLQHKTYSGTCLNRLAMGSATNGLFIQVVSLCKFEILESVLNMSIRFHVLWGDWCKTDDLYQLLNIWAHRCQSHPPDQRVLKESVPIRRWKWSVIENGDTLIAIFVWNNSHDLWWGVIIPLLITSEWSLVFIYTNRIKMGFGTKNHGFNLQFTSGLFRQVEWPIHGLYML